MLKIANTCAYYIYHGLPSEILSYSEMESASKNGKVVTNCEPKAKQGKTKQFCMPSNTPKIAPLGIAVCTTKTSNSQITSCE